ncbi:hypothetical protein CVT23_07545 [Minwuia thermotolerans]|uniref:Uncharacterized protein n=1 Tax=Minwuia thermotolerans TaxID=2056226 RepID=A0A2M9G3E1_9PROT|nr:hypothetical protein CVT23_07545 [Minwuia thermotolerans]
MNQFIDIHICFYISASIFTSKRDSDMITRAIEKFINQTVSTPVAVTRVSRRRPAEGQARPALD